MISKFELQAFRCFKEKQTLVFAIPNEDKVGSGLTYIVGKNNCGKTSILEGMKFMASQDIISSTLRHSDIRDSWIRFTFLDKNNAAIQDLSLVRDGSSKLKDSTAPNWPHDEYGNAKYPVFIPSRRHWSSQVNRDTDLLSLKQQYDFGNNISLRQRSDGYISDSQAADVFNALELDDRQYQKFIEMMRTIVPEFASFTTEKEDSAYITYEMADGSRHRADFLGDGVISVMRIIAYLILYPDRPIIIDEPELSLHPTALRPLGRILAEAAQHQQILLATHSPYLVDWEYLANGAKLNHVIHHDSESEIFTLQDTSNYEKLINGGNWKQPFLTDIVAKELFYNDNVLFVEGQEDVGLLRQEQVLDSSIQLFGYGVRGVDNFKFAFALAKDLGLEKVGALLDKGDKEDKIVGQLMKKYQKFLVVQWDRGDIRDKPELYSLSSKNKPKIEQQAKTGYFTEKGKKKPESELGDFYEKIKQINEYFKEKTHKDTNSKTPSEYFNLPDV